jgi:hypothetical protein
VIGHGQGGEDSESDEKHLPGTGNEEERSEAIEPFNSEVGGANPRLALDRFFLLFGAENGQSVPTCILLPILTICSCCKR